MKGVFHTFPKTLGEDFFHIVPPVSIMVAGSIARLIYEFSSLTENRTGASSARGLEGRPARPKWVYTFNDRKAKKTNSG
jgi:hypothetical protein